MNLYVDTREPERIRVKARELGFIPMALDVGDYSTDSIICERKSIGDLVNSIFARYGEQSRLTDQMERIYNACQERERIPVLIITGSIAAVEQEFKARGQTLNREAIYGAVASVMCRYAMNVLWTEQPIGEWLSELKKFAEKVEEGKFLLPQRKKLKEFARNRNVAAVSRALELSPHIAERMVAKFGGLYGVLEAAKHHPSEVLVMDGVGKKTYQKICELGGIV